MVSVDGHAIDQRYQQVTFFRIVFCQFHTSSMASLNRSQLCEIPGLMCVSQLIPGDLYLALPISKSVTQESFHLVSVIESHFIPKVKLFYWVQVLSSVMWVNWQSHVPLYKENPAADPCMQSVLEWTGNALVTS